MSNFERERLEFYEKNISNIANEIKLSHGDDIYPDFSVTIGVDDGYREADIIFELVIENKVKKHLVLMTSTVIEKKRVFIEKMDDKEGMQRARTYALKVKNGAYYGITNGKDVHIKAIDPDLFLDEKKPIQELKTILQMIIKEERRIKESNEFIKYLKEKHNEIEAYMEKRLTQKLEDKKFEEKIRQFLAPIGMSYNTKEEIPRETLNMLSMQGTYLLIDKILFYYLILENKDSLRKSFDKTDEFDKIFIGLEKESPYSEKIDINWSKKFWNYLENMFKLVQEIDYEPIFSTKNSPLNEIKLDNYPQACFYLKELMDYLYGKEKLSNLFDGPLLSKIYEGLIPSDLRWKWGQIYTPPEITRLIAEWAIRNPKDLVLDPACGTGRFLISAYERLMKLKGESLDKIHQDLLYQIRGIDINQFPAHLATMSLAAMNLDSITRKVNINVMDFLLLLEEGQSIFNPDEIRVHLAGQTEFGMRGKLVGQTAFTSDTKLDDPIGLVDAIIMNPPYTRQEALEKKYKNLFRDKALSGLVPTKKIHLSNRASYYSYFIIHGTKFLKNNGQFGMIIQNSWLDVDYGKDIQKFLLDFYCIKAIIGTEKHRLIQTAEVNTVIVLLEKESNKKKRENNLVKFVKLKKSVSWFEKNYQFENLLQMINEKENFINDELRIITKSQKELEEETINKSGKWGQFIKAPDIYFRLLDKIGNKFIPLKEITEICRGITTGANDFFYLPKPGQINKFFQSEMDEETGQLLLFIKSTNIEKIFRKQGFEISSPMFKIEKEYWMHKEDIEPDIVKDHFDFIYFQKDEMWIPNYGITRLHEIKSIIIKPKNLNRVVLMVHKQKKDLDYGIKKYIKWGETYKPNSGKMYPMRPTCKSRKLWYDLGKQSKQDIILPRFRHERNWNPIILYDIYIGDIVHVAKFIDKEFNKAFLNSSLEILFTEVIGRVNLGEGLLTTYGPEIYSLPVISENISLEIIDSINKKLLEFNKREVSSIFNELGTKNPDNFTIKNMKKDRRELDLIFMEQILGLNEIEQLEIYKEIIRLVKSRLEKAKSVEKV